MMRIPDLALLSSVLLATSCATPPDSRAYAPTSGGPGSALRGVPDGGTRYLTSVGLPNVGAVTLPDWVVNPTLDGVLGAVGVSSLNELGTGHQIDNARTSARLEIARMLEVRVQDVGRRDIEQRIRAIGDGELASDGSRKSMLGVDRNIADSVLSGSRQRAMWFDPSSGDCYVWMVMDGAVQKKADHYVENGVSVYVANTEITKEFRPERPKAPTPAPAAPEPKEPEPVLGPVERLESRLKALETIPVKDTKGEKK
jgi:hypothetical protein